MITNEFEYEVPKNLKQLQKLLAKDPEENKVIAGGMTLVPMMSLGLVTPSALISLRGVEEMRGISISRKSLVVGATTTHFEISQNSQIAELAPLLGEAAGLIGDVQVRNRGTIGGSLAHADPAANYLPTMFALDAEIETILGRKKRLIPVGEFYQGLMTTALKPGELIVAIHLPLKRADWGYRFVKFTRVKGNFPIVCAACMVSSSRSEGKVAIGGATPTPVVIDLKDIPATLDSVFEKQLREQVRRVVQQPLVDANGDEEYKTEMASVFAVKAVAGALERLNK